MTKTKSTKRALLTSALALLMCVSMLIGSTFAWFTDSVTSAGNIIKSGTLDVTMEWLDGKVAPTDDAAWIDASKGAIFNSTLWEPGYTEVRHIKIANEGTLALKYQLNIIANGEVSKLADVIDVYYIDPAEDAITDRAQLKEENILGTLTQVLANISTTASGNLKAGEKDTITLALKMQESAGNEYQNLAIGSDFSIQLLATQLTSEFDSFDNQYDAGATWTGTIPTSLDDTTLVVTPTLGEQTGTVTVNSPEDFVYLNKLANEWVSIYSNGQGTNVGSYRESAGGKGTDYYYYWTWNVELTADLDMNNIPMDAVNLAFWKNFDGNGHTISNVVLKDGQDGLFATAGDNGVSNLTVKNITVNAPTAETVGALAGSAGGFENVHVENATVNGAKYVGAIAGKCASVINSTVNNAVVNCSGKTVGGLVGYSIGDPNAATVTGNTVENTTVIGTYNVGGLLGQSQNETVENNTVKNVTVTSTTALPADASSNEVRAAEIAARSAFDNTTIGENTVENVTVVPEPATKVSTVDGLKKALNEGKNVVLTENIALNSTLMATKDVVIDLNGKTITAPSNSAMFQSSSDTDPSMIITSSKSGAVINAGSNAVLLGYGSTEISNVTINVENATSTSKPFNVYGDLTLGEGTVVNVNTLGTSLISSNGAVAIVIDGAKINIGEFKVNGSQLITLNKASTFEMKNTAMKIDNFVLSTFGGEGLVNKIDGVTIENCTFDVTDSNGASCTFVADAGLGRYDLVQK